MVRKLSVEVVAGDADAQILRRLDVAEGATVMDAVKQADLETDYPALVIDQDRLGIFGRRVDADQVLKDGDRIEVYRPLKADPKEVRRQLAELAKKR